MATGLLGHRPPAAGNHLQAGQLGALDVRAAGLRGRQHPARTRSPRLRALASVTSSAGGRAGHQRRPQPLQRQPDCLRRRTVGEKTREQTAHDPRAVTCPRSSPPAPPRDAADRVRPNEGKARSFETEPPSLIPVRTARTKVRLSSSSWRTSNVWPRQLDLTLRFVQGSQSQAQPVSPFASWLGA